MLRRVPDKVRHCYARALGCRERGQLARDRVVKANWVAMEDRWIALAQRYELEETVIEFGAEIRRFLRGGEGRARLANQASARSAASNRAVLAKTSVFHSAL